MNPEYSVVDLVEPVYRWGVIHRGDTDPFGRFKERADAQKVADALNKTNGGTHEESN